MRKLFCLFVFVLFFADTPSAQLLEDEPTQLLISKGLNSLYNLNFSAAEQSFGQISASYDNHPVGDFLKAFMLQWQYLPIDKNPTALKKYTALLKSCKIKAEQLAKEPRYKAEATFFLLASHGYIALSYNYQKEYTKAVMDANHAYGYLKDGFAFTSQNPDFFFTTGIYNFYRVQYPELHPIVKPFVVFFQNGNKQTGISQLKMAASKAVFSKIEASTYLTNIYLKYEANFAQALVYAHRLGKAYPNNFIFKIRYTEALLFNNRFEEARQNVAFLKAKQNDISLLSASFFEGYIAEFEQKNDAQAIVNYAAALKYEPNSRYTQEYFAMAYLGLGRIMKRKGDKAKAKLFIGKCLENAEYQWVVSAAKRELNGL